MRASALEAKDVGSTWTQETNPVPSTVQIGGRVGPANVKDAEAEGISAFKKPPAYITSNVFLLESTELAQGVLLAHNQAEDEETWVQERKDGGGARFKRVGDVEDLPDLGEESYSARLSVTVTDAKGDETKRKIQYVVFRVNRLVAFVIAQDANVGKLAARQEKKVVSLTG